MSSAAFVAVTVQVWAPLLALSTLSTPLAGSIEQLAVVSTTLHTMPPSPEPPVVARLRVEP